MSNTNHNNHNIIFRSETSEKNNNGNYLNDLFSYANKSNDITTDSDTDNKINFNFFNNNDTKQEENDKLGTIYEDFYDTEGEAVIDDNDRDKYLFNKYILKNNKSIEKRNMNEPVNQDSELFKLVSKNNYQEIKKYFKLGNTLFKSNKLESNIIIKSLCVKNNCVSCKTCYKTPVYLSLRNTNRGIKTIYYYLLKLLIIKKNFRILCECCKNKKHSLFIERMDELYKNKNYDEILQVANSCDSKEKMELEISFYINKFMKILGFLDCECKYAEHKKIHYSEKFLNFSSIYELYLTTIQELIKLLKKYYSINENNEELYLIDENRCIHEDIQYYGMLKYCTKKNDKKINLIRNENELVMKIENANIWTVKSIQINILLLNEQNLELFNYELLGNYNQGSDYKCIFDKLYKTNNVFINLDHKLENQGIIKTILKSKLPEQKMMNIISSFINQYKVRNRKKKSFENTMINYTKESIEEENYIMGAEFMKEILNSSNIEKSPQTDMILKYIFDKIIATEKLTIENKISFLKIINKNKINVCEYDFIYNLIDYKNGDDIILGFDKYSNNMFKIKNYDVDIYIKEIIKKCITSIKINILDYVLYNLKDKINYYKIDPVNIYLTNIKKKEKSGNIFRTFEYKYVHLLQIILKYEQHDNNLKNTKYDNYYSAINYCIEHHLVQSAKLFIENKFIKNDKKLLEKCIIKNNHIIAESIISGNPQLVEINYDNLNLLNFIFFKSMPSGFSDDNSIVQFIKKILHVIIHENIDTDILNYDDEYNKSFGFLLLGCDKIQTKNKIYLFNYAKELIDPMKINNYYDREVSRINTKNIPLVLYSCLMEEYEITFILLNHLILHDMLDRNKKESDSLFDNYCRNDKININIIPVVIKYLKDNNDYHENFDENDIGGVNNFLDTDLYPLVIVLICMKMLCAYLKIIYENYKNIRLALNKNNLCNRQNKQNIFINNNTKNKNDNENNKYEEIEIKNKFKNTLFDTDSNINYKRNNHDSYDSDESTVTENDIMF
jgi:hypothetical protein